VIDVAEAPVKHYATIDSTNTEARRLFEAGERGPLWLLADEQTAGRGRLERKWVSERGNCYSTLIVPMTANRGTIGFAVALAVADVAARYAENVALKWPNDVLVNGAKVSGILCEVLSPDTIAVGCGINVAHAPQGLAYPATHLNNANREDVFANYRSCLSHWLNIWCTNFATVRAAWISRAIGIGEQTSMIVGEQTHSGTYEGIDDSGAIILSAPNGVSRTFHAGDLVIPSLQALRKQTA
jgi:BirA family transcriptional regulator, biotin operon repressor / biotin---[acetyl-CoA-carboxylase] ligase